MERTRRSPTFFVTAEKQRAILSSFQRREDNLSETYRKNRPLCFHARSAQKTHPIKAREGHRDADVTLESPMILGVADGVSQVEDFGIDASELPRELLSFCEDIAMSQLIPGSKVAADEAYQGPIFLLKEAFEATEALGSTTVALAILDNSTKIHGNLHPMIAVITVGDCELLILRRTHGPFGRLQPVFRTEMQRIDGHMQTPLQLARVDERIDPDFHEDITIEVIEKGSAVHCVSAYPGDIVVMGSDGVFDNLFLDEIADLCNRVLRPGGQNLPTHHSLLGYLAKSIVKACHAKSQCGPDGVLPAAPIGRGGKIDDTSVVVAEVVEWTKAHSEAWLPRRNIFPASWNLNSCNKCCVAGEGEEVEFLDGNT